MWDLTVDVTHCFVANDIVVHNTTTAVLAAATLARAVRPGGKRVALVDANTAQSSVATILQRPARGSILDLVRTEVDEDMLAQALTPVPEAGDLDVLFGAPDLRCADERLLTPRCGAGSWPGCGARTTTSSWTRPWPRPWATSCSTTSCCGTPACCWWCSTPTGRRSTTTSSGSTSSATR